MVPRPYFDDRGNVLPFDKVMQLEKIDDRTYRSIVKAYSPTGGENGTYGGHVYAQAAWAAAQTVDEGFLIHVCFSVPTPHAQTNMFTCLIERHRLVYARRQTNRALRLHGPQNSGRLQLLHSHCDRNASRRTRHNVHMHLFLQARRRITVRASRSH